MKLMIASDIHGSAMYAGQLIEAYKKEQPDNLVLLGDLLYHGPRNPLPEGYDPKAVFEMLNRIGKNIIAVRGNCDSEVDQMVLEFPMMADYLVIDTSVARLFLTHGHLFNPHNPPANLWPGALLFNGHTHEPAVEKLDGFVYVNPGSVTIQKPNTQRGYMVLSCRELSHKALDGSVIGRYQI